MAIATHTHKISVNENCRDGYSTLLLIYAVNLHLQKGNTFLSGVI
jgi:hypothetical protein